MRPARRYAVIAAAVLVAVAALVAVAMIRGGDEESPSASPTATTSTGASTTPATTETTEATATTNVATTNVATTGVTDTNEPAATTAETRTGTSGPATTTPTAPRPYALAPTRRCLLDAGFVVSKIRSTDPRLRALGDLAQRTSLQLRLDGQTMGLAFANASLLLSLLRVPNDPYRLEVDRNALLMYRPAARPQAKIAIGCLRN